MRRRPVALVLLTSLVVLAIPASVRTAAASWTRDPSTNLVVSALANDQLNPKITSDGQGGSIIAWQDSRSGEYDIYAQRVDAKGVPLWTANGIAVCTASGAQFTPAIVSDGAGGAIILWLDLRAGVRQIFGQRLSASGTPSWTANGVAVCNVFSVKDYLVAAADGSGGAIAAWSDTRNGGGLYDVFAQRVNASGTSLWTAAGVMLTSGGQDQINNRIVADGTGGAYVCWHDSQWISGVQRVNSTGVVQWGANGIALPGTASSPAITTDAAGGAIVAWLCIPLAGCSDDGFRAQRFNAAGSPLWGSLGTLLIPTACSNIVQHSIDLIEIAPDGAGGAITVSSDRRNGNGNRDLFAQRVNAAGVRLWAAGGVAVCTAPGEQAGWHPIASDGSGGATIVWHDPRSGSIQDGYAQRINAAGAVQWTTDGVLLSTAPSHQSGPHVLDDGRQGAIVVWHDYRSGAWDVYAQRVDQYGNLGDPAPEIAWVKDVPNDQGERVRIRWNASYRDTLPTLGVVAYGIWRQVTESAATAAVAKGARRIAAGEPARPEGGVVRAVTLGAQTTWWEGVGTVLATGDPWYTFVAGTFQDSTSAGNPLTTFMVDARDASAPRLWSSLSATGYSVDNLPPAIPGGFANTPQGGAAQLSWSANTEDDLGGYRVYRGNTADFVPGPANRIATVSAAATSYTDSPAGSFYKLSAVDVHGNESGFALAGGTTGVGDGPRAELSLARPSPNPARRSAAIRFALPADGAVALQIHDAQGRLVRRLVSGARPAGENLVAWDLCDDQGGRVADGLYWVRLERNGVRLVQRLVTLR